MKITPVLLTALMLALAGCSTVPLPDGSKVSRLPETDAPAPVLTAEERQRYNEVDRQVLREQQAARESERRVREAEAHRRAAPPEYYMYGYGWPHVGWGLNWYWTGHRWAWRPHWGVGIHIWP